MQGSDLLIVRHLAVIDVYPKSFEFRRPVAPRFRRDLQICRILGYNSSHGFRVRVPRGLFQGIFEFVTGGLVESVRKSLLLIKVHRRCSPTRSTTPPVHCQCGCCQCGKTGARAVREFVIVAAVAVVAVAVVIVVVVVVVGGACVAVVVESVAGAARACSQPRPKGGSERGGFPSDALNELSGGRRSHSLGISTAGHRGSRTGQRGGLLGVVRPTSVATRLLLRHLELTRPTYTRVCRCQ
mmetsp:Transcript_7338/g.16618  ORF Transcript_7338/g.16618 Transcript_7338/m.16618 type:complete len:240 (-) Transcript_7338:58-777(-)